MSRWPAHFPDFLNGLIAGKIPVTLASLGNPYLVRSFPNASAYLTTYSPTPTSETSLAKALVRRNRNHGTACRSPFPASPSTAMAFSFRRTHPPQKGL